MYASAYLCSVAMQQIMISGLPHLGTCSKVRLFYFVLCFTVFELFQINRFIIKQYLYIYIYIFIIEYLTSQRCNNKK